MLSIQNIAKSFNSLHVLDNISFDVKNGEFVAIVGPSGSGKSTLFQLIGGVSSVDQGVILLNGEDILQKEEQLAICHSSLVYCLGVLF